MPAIFPRWTNRIPIVLGLVAPLAGAGLIFAIWYWFSPLNTDVGYRPRQPIPYSHKLHAGEMGMDCRYCHNTVEFSATAAIPPSGTCMNCHQTLVRTTATGGVYENRLKPLHEAYAKDEPVEWVRVHQLPDFAFFNHSAHLAAGVGCVTCHGRVDQMDIVETRSPLSMSWCLDCHRNPEPNLRPLDQVTNMAWDPEADPYDPDRDPQRKRKVDPPLHCSGCHR